MITLTEPSTCCPASPRRPLSASLLPQPACYQLHLQREGLQPDRVLRRRAGDLPEVIELSRGAARAASLLALKPLRLACTAGVVWLTREGDPHDYVLESGDHHAVQPGDLIALLGMPKGAVRVSCS